MGQQLCCSSRDSATADSKWPVPVAPDSAAVDDLREEMEKMQELAENMLNRVSLLLSEKEQLATSYSLLERENEALREDLEQQNLDVIEQHYRQLEEHRRQLLLDEEGGGFDDHHSETAEYEDAEPPTGGLSRQPAAALALVLAAAPGAALDSPRRLTSALHSAQPQPEQRSISFDATTEFGADLYAVNSPTAVFPPGSPCGRLDCGMETAGLLLPARVLSPCNRTLQAFQIGSPREKPAVPAPCLWASSTAQAAATAAHSPPELWSQELS